MRATIRITLVCLLIAVAGSCDRPAEEIEEALSPLGQLDERLRRLNERQAKAQINAFVTMLMAYHLDVGSYPGTSQGLAALRVPPPEIDANKWAGPYSSQDIPLDPWGNPYQYQLVSPEQFRLWSWGPDGQDGTEDDIATTGPDSPAL
jgi:type II secretion system protein G